MRNKELTKIPLFEKIDFIRKIVFEATKIQDDAVITRMLARLCRKGGGYYRQFSVLNLTNNEIILGELLKTHKISPKTAYKWFLILRSKGDVLERLKNNEISASEAYLLERQRKQYPEQLGKEIKEEIIELIRRM